MTTDPIASTVATAYSPRGSGAPVRVPPTGSAILRPVGIVEGRAS